MSRRQDWSPRNNRDLPVLMARRIRTAINESGDAFWARVSRNFPEVARGNFAPDAVREWDQAVESAVLTWLAENFHDIDLVRAAARLIKRGDA